MSTEKQDEPAVDASRAADGRAKRRFDWKAMLGQRKNPVRTPPRGRSMDTSDTGNHGEKRPVRWNMGMLNDHETDEVPGSVLLLSKVNQYNEPLGLRNEPARTSASSLPPISKSRSRSQSSSRRWKLPQKKYTADGKFVLEPQPDDSLNDPLNWKVWRRDAALLSLGFYCMLGGGMTTVLAAGFNEVASDFEVSEPSVALTTGLYMLGLGVGSVVLSPTAILFGKRPVYLAAAICFSLSGVWCALSPNFGILIGGRVFMGVAVSSVECLPSASIAEIYFLHEKAYRLGIYTLLLLGGKNLVPLVSAAIIGGLGWRWVFWMVTIVVALGSVLLFLFVPETFWDRSPRPSIRPKAKRSTSLQQVWTALSRQTAPTSEKFPEIDGVNIADAGSGHDHKAAERHAHFQDALPSPTISNGSKNSIAYDLDLKEGPVANQSHSTVDVSPKIDEPVLHEETPGPDIFRNGRTELSQLEAQTTGLTTLPSHASYEGKTVNPYTRHYLSQPPKTYVQQLKPYAGRLCQDNWFKVAMRPFILFAYPSILWSALVYSLSIGWLIVLSESVTQIYKSSDTYNFTSLQAGLVYISPFVGGVLGTAVAGKVSDLVVRFMARRNGGVYEPEFRLVMAVPIAITTVVGLMGYGWSVQERDAWIVPTIFFGIISFGCSLGSTTSITFAVDSYRQYAGEALVTLNFSKNILHGMVFSFFFNNWLESEGSRDVFLAVGGIQLACMLLTIPMYIFGKRARMWTVRKGLMERF